MIKIQMPIANVLFNPSHYDHGNKLFAMQQIRFWSTISPSKVSVPESSGPTEKNQATMRPLNKRAMVGN